MIISHDKKADYYDDIYSKSQKYLDPAKHSPYKAVWDAVLEKLPSACSILDIGCGPGQFATLCIEANHPYVGADFSEVAIARGQQIAPEGTFHLVNIVKDRNLLTKGDYDAVTLTEFLEHINEDLETLSFIPEGKRVVLTVPRFWCEGHVRTFKTPSSVALRYEKLIDIESLDTLELGDPATHLEGPSGPLVHEQRWKIYVLSGTRKKVK